MSFQDSVGLCASSKTHVGSRCCGVWMNDSISAECEWMTAEFQWDCTAEGCTRKGGRNGPFWDAPHLTLGWHDVYLGCVFAQGALHKECGTQTPWLAPPADSAQPIRTPELAYRKLWKGEGKSKFFFFYLPGVLISGPKSGFFTHLGPSPVGSTPVQGWRACGFMSKGKKWDE